LREAAARGDIVVVVDVLSFSTSVVTAVLRGGSVVPCALDADARALGERHDAVVAVHRGDAPELGRYSLSPRSFLAMSEGESVVLPSPNGGACSSHGGDASYLFAGAILNAAALGHVISRLVETTDHTVTVVAAGERYDEPSEDGVIRFAVEDYLGAGAILAAIASDKSPEAEVCENAFVQVRHRINEILWGSESGRELRERGYKDDVHFAAQLDGCSAVPVLIDGRFVAWSPPDRKALAYVTRRRGDALELLVFEHADVPDAGLQVPAGTIDVGEDPEWAALREAEEETGLSSLRVVRHLTTHTLWAPWSSSHHERHVYHLELDGEAPDTWTHIVTAGDERGIRFAFRWHDLSNPLELAGRQGEYLEYLLASLESREEGGGRREEGGGANTQIRGEE
jgi:2-phosphosulfolactate phosphatase